jgi:hypothetical protein
MARPVRREAVRRRGRTGSGGTRPSIPLGRGLKPNPQPGRSEQDGGEVVAGGLLVIAVAMRRKCFSLLKKRSTRLRWR